MTMNKNNVSESDKPKVIALSWTEQTRRIQEAVARRAYEIFISRASKPGTEGDDWRMAEAEIVSPPWIEW